jgi:hypothetical protein
MNKTAYRVLSILVIAAFIVGNITPAYAQATNVVTEAEQEREKQLTRELSLNLPETTDDPNYPMTFVDPSGKGVEVTINDKVISNAQSPMILPNLAIGKYTIAFKFTSKEGLVRVLSKNLIIAPKAPSFDSTIKTRVVRPAQVVLNGTALPASTVQIIINSQKVHKVTTNQEGKWELIVPDPTEGKMHIIAFVIRDGFTSEPSKTIEIEYLLNENTVNPVTAVTATEDKTKELLKNVYNYVQQNPNEFYLAVAIAIAFIVLILVFTYVRRNRKQKEEKTLATQLKNLVSSPNILAIMDDNDATDSKSKNQNEKSKDQTKEVVTNEEKKVKTKNKKAETNNADTLQNKKSKIKKQKEKKKESETKEEVTAKPPEAKQENKTTEEEVSEPQKKTLSKEEFLKQFQVNSENEQSEK